MKNRRVDGSTHRGVDSQSLFSIRLSERQSCQNAIEAVHMVVFGVSPFALSGQNSKSMSSAVRFWLLFDWVALRFLMSLMPIAFLELGLYLQNNPNEAWCA